MTRMERLPDALLVPGKIDKMWEPWPGQMRWTPEQTF
jgi:hypothetical protein